MWRLLILVAALCIAHDAWGAINPTTVWEFRADATSGNTMPNGGGFDPAATFAITDAAATSATGNAPVVTSATYTFVAGDVDDWIYVQAGTAWVPGWYKITAVNTGAATVDATVGAAVWVPTNAACTGSTAPWPCCTGSTTGTCTGQYQPNTVAGVASTASPTGGTIGVDRTQKAAAYDTGTDLASADGDAVPCVVSSGTHNFLPEDVGNFVHITETGDGFTVGWYRIDSVAGNAATLDRACGTNGSKANGDWALGGALALDSTSTAAGLGPDGFFEQVVGGNRTWIRTGTYALGSAVGMANTSCTIAAPCQVTGYKTLRSDTPIGSDRPTINTQTSTIVLTANHLLQHLIIKGQPASTTLTIGGGTYLLNSKILSLTASGTRSALSLGAATTYIINSELVSLSGHALNQPYACYIFNSYLHDSVNGISGASNTVRLFGSVLAHNTTSAVTTSGAQSLLIGNTFYGNAAHIGTGFLSTTATGALAHGNIFSGFATGWSGTWAPTHALDYNDWYNNGTNWDSAPAGLHELAVDPQFVSVSQITGTTATTAASVLTDTGKDFSAAGVVDNESYLHVTSGTGVTVGGYLITGHDTTTITTNNALGTSSAGNVVYWITTPGGSDFRIGANLKAQGWPNTFGYSGTTPVTLSYPDTGAVQRQEQDTPTPAPTPTWWPATPTAIPTCG